MKKNFYLFLSLLFVIVAFSGCTGDISEPIQDNVDNNITEETTLHNETVPEGYIGIYTVEDFDYLRNSSTGQYILMNDIDMSNIDDWDGINFQGTFDGNNYEIQNYHFENGFFDTTTNAVISNITISANISKTTYVRDDGTWTNGVGVLANCITTNYSESALSKITNIKIKGEIHHTCGKEFGTIAGVVEPGCKTATVTMSNIVNEAKIYDEKGCDSVGGVIGAVYQQSSSNEYFPAFDLSNTVNKGDIYVKSEVACYDGSKIGGILGEGYGDIRSCDNYGQINIDCPIAKDNEENDGGYRENFICGGIIGANGYYTKGYTKIVGHGYPASINSCANYGSIISENCEYTGGIIGYTVEGYDLSDCGNFASISGVKAGGIQGGGCYLAPLYNCINTGSINGTNQSGAIICDFFSNAPEPQNCYYLNNGVNCVGVKAAFPNVYSIEENQLADSSVINLGDSWSIDSNGIKLNSTIENSKL